MNDAMNQTFLQRGKRSRLILTEPESPKFQKLVKNKFKNYTVKTTLMSTSIALNKKLNGKKIIDVSC